MDFLSSHLDGVVGLCFLGLQGVTAFLPGMPACTDAKGEGGNKGEGGGTWKAKKGERQRLQRRANLQTFFRALRATSDTFLFDYMRPYNTNGMLLCSGLPYGAYGAVHSPI